MDILSKKISAADLDLGVTHSEESLKLSVIIPTYNSSHAIAMTLESVLAQDFENFEVIVVDAGSEDRTHEIIKSFYDKRIRVYTVTSHHRYEMLNKGISLATGDYVNFLFPGDFYLYGQIMNTVIDMVKSYHLPHLIYGGSLLRDGRSEVKVLFRNLSSSELKLGHQPTSLQSCWIAMKTFRTVGKFSTDYTLRGGFEWMCRYSLQKNMHTASTRRVLSDYDLKGITKRKVLCHFVETMRAIYTHFGWMTTLHWLFVQKDTRRIFHLWVRSVKASFLEG